MSEDVWNDIGDRSKKKELGIYRNLQGPPAEFRYEREAHEKQKKINLELLKSLDPNLNELENPIIISLRGRAVEFWPASNTYYSRALNKFGWGIPELVEKMKKFVRE